MAICGWRGGDCESVFVYKFYFGVITGLPVRGGGFAVDTSWYLGFVEGASRLIDLVKGRDWPNISLDRSDRRVIYGFVCFHLDQLMTQVEISL